MATYLPWATCSGEAFEGRSGNSHARGPVVRALCESARMTVSGARISPPTREMISRGQERQRKA